MELLLVRHTSLVIEKDICYGQSEVLPSSNFMVEAEKVKLQLEDFNPDLVFTSPLSRCSMLASQAGFPDADENELLLEYNFGDWEMQPWDILRGVYVDRWMKDFINVPAPNGENMIDMVNRLSTFINQIREAGKNKVLAFTHAGPIRSVKHIINGIPLENVFDEKVNYGSVNRFTI